MAELHLTAADVARLLGLAGTHAVEDLVAAKMLDIAAFTSRGRPLFRAEAVRRIAFATPPQDASRAT